MHHKRGIELGSSEFRPAACYALGCLSLTKRMLPPVRDRTNPAFRVRIPAPMRRLAAVGILAVLLATSVIYSRDGRIAADVTARVSKQAFVQPKNRELIEARFIPAATVTVAEKADDKRLEVATTGSAPRSRPLTPGHYYELVRAQGDGEEGEYVLVERQCVPKIDMPEPCYLPERIRQNFPLRKE